MIAQVGGRDRKGKKRRRRRMKERQTLRRKAGLSGTAQCVGR